MAKEQWHDWGRYIFLAIVIIFAGGGYAMKIDGNSDNIKKNIEDIEKVEDTVHAVQLKQRDEAATKDAIFATLNRLETEQTSARIARQKGAIDITEIKTKVNTLIKDK